MAGPARYRYLIPSADVVLSNDEELVRVYEVGSLEKDVKSLCDFLATKDQKDSLTTDQKQAVCGAIKATLNITLAPETIENPKTIDKASNTLFEAISKHYEGAPCKLTALITAIETQMGDDSLLEKFKLKFKRADQHKEEYYYETQKEAFEKAMHELKGDISKRDEVLAKDRKKPHPKPPIAFITCGKEGARVVTPNSDDMIDPPVVTGHKKLFSLGAGDNAYAGFLAGHVAGLSPTKSASLGMQMAGAKLAFDGARVPDPREALEKFSASGKELLREIDTNLGRGDRSPP